VSTTDSSSTVAAISPERAAEIYGTMALIRRFEEVAYRAYEQGEIEGTIHVSIGQEGVATGVISALRESDKVLSHHRGHGHALAKGVDPARLMAELCARRSGVSKGKGGSMHATDVVCGFLGTLAVVASSIPLAVGVGLALQLDRKDDVCVVFFGDGGINQGVLYESFNLAALWGLPVLFVCENNAYAITTRSEDSIAGDGVAARATTFGINASVIDGQDVIAVREITDRLLAGVREGRPALLECLTYRFMGHSRGDPAHGVYRSEEELKRWRERDPLELLADAAGLDAQTRAEQEREADRTVQAALEFALASPRPGPEDATSEVWG
jgi:TPP-dependent pyruvate/acetoin dehydrogenase alpha subunit